MIATNSASNLNSNFYQVGASLPVDAPSYVERKADEEFYQKLLDGKFCYVLNSRQMGKSSLRVRTMQRLQKEGRVCAAIDLTGIGKVTEQQWYGGIVYNLSESCQLEDKFNFDWQIWWDKYQGTLSPVQCLSLFIEKVLLANIQEQIVIFVDEIDKILSQDFSLDDFFALIRFFQNQRVDNPIFKRLTFALLGVATPGNLIRDKTQTPFNIGEAIELNGFQIEEVKPLIKGLRGKFNNPQEVMRSILDWTGGQPFLSQKLCQFMVETYHGTSLQNSHGTSLDYFNLVEEVVKLRIIENWESQDDPEHLRTIRDRILSNEQRAGYLLELYQQIQEQGEVVANNSVESSNLRLSGLVVKREGKLRVYNRVYQQVFDRGWVEVQLRNLRPYSEAFRAWVASENKDESRLLQGKALADAEEWANDKNLSYQDKQFLAASKEKEIAVRNQEAELERERKDREAAEQRNQVLSDANKKAKRRISIGSIILLVTLLGAIASVIVGVKQVETANRQVEEAKDDLVQAKQQEKSALEQVNKANQTVRQVKRQEKLALEQVNKAKQTEKIAKDNELQAKQNAQTAKEKLAEVKQKLTSAQKTEKIIKDKLKKIESEIKENSIKNQEIKITINTVQALSKLAGTLRNENRTTASDEALRQAGLSFRVDDHHLKQAMLLASMAQAYQELKQPAYAQSNFDESLKYLNEKGNISSAQGLQIKAIVKGMQGNLIKEKNKSEAIKAYQEAFYILNNHPRETDPFKDDQIITAESIESVHKELFKLRPNQEVRDSLKEYYYTKLKHSLNKKYWREADIANWELMLVIANRIKERYLSIANIEQFSCPDLRKMDELWVKHSDGDFGFSVQKEIWVKTGNRLGIKTRDWNESDLKNYLRFASTVGWYNDTGKGNRKSGWINNYDDLISTVVDSQPNLIRGGLPFFLRERMSIYEGVEGQYYLVLMTLRESERSFLLALQNIKCNI
ncbi:AAA-like domain-containing protein [Mastigocoleus testarum]|uniref:AAA-like domain-containing protein n=1 Tax=Mastigocoleus testarum TaxID=996925 RepID=UPI0003FAB6E8|nr:AAA-like domain-containing protein [Mastigocoleus testarum]